MSIDGGMTDAVQGAPQETIAERNERLDDRWADARLESRGWWATMRADEEQERVDRKTKGSQ
jgi:hypothetical protein